LGHEYRDMVLSLRGLEAKTIIVIIINELKCKFVSTRRQWYDDRLCGLVVRVPGYRSRGPGLDSQLYQICLEVVGLQRGPLSLVSTIEDLRGRKSNGSLCGLVVQCSWLQIQGSQVRFPVLPDFLRSSGFGKGSTQPRE
jgi:hypothetical protein